MRLFKFEFIDLAVYVIKHKHLPFSKMLRVPHNVKDLDEAVTLSISYIDDTSNYFLEELTITAVYALYTYGLIKRKDVNIKQVDPNVYGSHYHTISVNSYDVRKVITLICAMKLNYFSCNSHAGEGELTGYTKRTFSNLYDPHNNMIITEEVVSTLNMIGNWASTSLILSSMGIEGLAGERHYNGIMSLRFGEDFLSKLHVMPAGTAIVGICFSIIKRMMRTKMIFTIPDAEMIHDVCTTYWHIRENRARYHVCSIELTLEEQIIIDKEKYMGYLGFLGTFMHTFYPHSEACKSHLICKDGVLVYREYSAYDKVYEDLCIQIKDAMSRGNAGALERLATTIRFSSPDKYEAIENAIKKARFN